MQSALIALCRSLLFPGIDTTAALLDTGFEHLAEQLWLPVLDLCVEETL